MFSFDFQLYIYDVLYVLKVYKFFLLFLIVDHIS